MNEEQLKIQETKTEDIDRKLSTKIDEMSERFREFKEEEFSPAKREQFEKIDSKFDLLKTEVKEKFTNFETEIVTVKENVVKIEEKQKNTEEYLGISEKTQSNQQNLEEMRDYLDYNKEYNKKEQLKRIEKKSK